MGGLGLAFAGLVWAWQGPTAGGEYLAGYLIEKALSVDNIFVFVLIFSYFARARRLPAPGAVLGHPRRAGHARRCSSPPAPP